MTVIDQTASRHRPPVLIRRLRRRSGVLATLTVAVATLVGSSSARADATAPRAAAASYLCSIPTGSGSLIGPTDRHLTLRLTDARDYLTRFTATTWRHG